MLRVGIAGIGFMGMIHYLAYQRLTGVKVVALCETNRKRLEGDWTDIQGNFGPRGEMMDLTGIARYTELGDMVADANVDLVDICLPPALHHPLALQALQGGKHVFSEKPIALAAEQGAEMVAEADRAGKLLMVGQVLPFFPEYRFAYEAITSGRYGKLLGGHFRRIISDPTWIRDFYSPGVCGGPMLDLHVHDAHFIRLICGMPRAVRSLGRMRGEVVEFFTSQYLFDDPSLAVTATSGVIYQQGRPFTHAYEIYLEKATLLFDFTAFAENPTVVMPVTVLTADGQVERPTIAGGDPIDAFVGELSEAARAVAEGSPSPLLNGELARDAVILCQRQTESVRSGCEVSLR